MSKIWRFLECPECGDDGWTDEPRVEYCGVCAGDCGRDVRMMVMATSEGDDKPTERPRVQPAPPPPSDDKLNAIRLLVNDWLGKQGHDACWYYPDVFRQIASVLGIEAPPVGLPPRCEFESGCKRYQDEVYKEPTDDHES